jgi:hypothetical protein
MSENSSMESDEELSSIMADLKGQMEELHQASNQIHKDVANLYKRAKQTDLEAPLHLKPHVRDWLKKRGLPKQLTMSEFLDACYDAAKKIDLESRVITFHTEDAAVLWNGQRRLTVFDMVSLLPGLT